MKKTSVCEFRIRRSIPVMEGSRLSSKDRLGMPVETSPECEVEGLLLSEKSRDMFKPSLELDLFS